ncbi:hypothetical protein BDF22DRAFT_57616 [Syncephalis plumigaleata]|nr:hypothetical protein BDF22DRAFT_57616 [Syncephalis plumigaleata]
MSLLSGNNIANGNELSLQIDNNGPFYPGDSVKGQISTHLPYMCVRGELTVRLFGVLDSQIGGNLNMDVKEFHTQEIRLWLNPNGDNSNENLTNQQGYPMCGSLPAGQQHYPFSFTLPDGIYALPSSFDAPQNQLRYTVRVELRGSFESNSAESVISQLCSQLLSSHITRRVERLICVRNYVDADQPGLCRPISQVGHLSRASWFGKLTRAAASVATNRRSKKSSAMELLMPVLNPIITRNVTSTEHTPRLRLSMSRTGYCPGEWVHMTINMDHGNDLDTALASPPPPSLISSSASSVSSSSSVSDAESIEEQSSGIELPEIHRRSSASFVNLVSEQLLQQQRSEQRPQSRGRRVTLSGMSVPHDHLLQVPFTWNPKQHVFPWHPLV